MVVLLQLLALGTSIAEFAELPKSTASLKSAEEFSSYLVARQKGKSPKLPIKLTGKIAELVGFSSGPPNRIQAGDGENLLKVILNLPAEKGDTRTWVFQFTVTPEIDWRAARRDDFNWNRAISNRLVTQYHIVEYTKDAGVRDRRVLETHYRDAKKPESPNKARNKRDDRRP